MGAWGTAITSDDTVLDVIDSMNNALKKGKTLSEATELALTENKDLLKDKEQASIVWLAIAQVQWKHGAVEEEVLNVVRSDVEQGNGLELWSEDPKLLKKRVEALSKFVLKISQPNPKPSPLPKSVTRLAPFEAGDCLSVLTSDNRYTAAIVLAVDNRNIENGMNLVGALDFLSHEPPEANLFEKRQWLYLHHGEWKGQRDLFWALPTGFARQKKRFSIVSKTKLRFLETKKSSLYSSWQVLGTHILAERGASAF